MHLASPFCSSIPSTAPRLRQARDSGIGTHGRDGPTPVGPTGIAPEIGNTEKNHRRRSGFGRAQVINGRAVGTITAQSRSTILRSATLRVLRMCSMMSLTSSEQRVRRGFDHPRGCANTRENKLCVSCRKSWRSEVRRNVLL